MRRASRGTIAASLLGAVAILATGCGELTIRTWVTVVEDEIGGSVSIDLGRTVPWVFDMLRIQGGLLTEEETAGISAVAKASGGRNLYVLQELARQLPVGE